MNRSPDVELVLRDYFADDGLTAPDYVLDVVEGRISRQPQRRTWPFQGRTNVTTQIKLIAGLAAALVVAIVAYNLLPGISGPGTPTTAPTPSVQPTAAPSAGARWPTWYPAEAVRDANGAGILSAGSQATRVFGPAFTYGAADGWVNAYDEPNDYTLFPDSPANAAQYASSDELAHHIFMGLHSSPYFTCESAENNRGTTAAEMVAAMTANEVLAMSGLVDVAIGGLTGKQFDVRRSPDWTGTCPGDSELPPGLDPVDERTRAILLDAPGGGVLVIFMYSWSSAEHDAFLAEAMPIVESFQFDLGQ
jgi:hypothetical protein